MKKIILFKLESFEMLTRCVCIILIPFIIVFIFEIFVWVPPKILSLEWYSPVSLLGRKIRVSGAK